MKNDKMIHVLEEYMRRHMPKLSKSGTITQADHNSVRHCLKTMGCTEDGIDWLIPALDPAHHVKIPAGRMPTGYDGRTYVKQVEKKFTMAIPAALTNDAFDMHVAILPWQTELNTYGAGSIEDALKGSVSAGQMAVVYSNETPSVTKNPETFNAVLVNLLTAGEDPQNEGSFARLPGGLIKISYRNTAVANLQGTNIAEGSFVPASQSNSAEVFEQLFISDLTPSQNSMLRIVGMSMKIVNTTPEINAGGDCTMYSLPYTPLYDPDLYVLGALPDPNGVIIEPGYNIGSLMVPFPPTTSEEASLLSSVTYKATEGAFIVPRLQMCNTSFKRPVNSTVTMVGTPDVSEPLFTGSSTVKTFRAFTTGRRINDTVNDPSQAFIDAQCKSTLFGMDAAGAYFTGLPRQSTFTGIVKINIEVAPKPYSSDMTTAHPAPCKDAIALAIYDFVSCKMPPGHPSDDNGLGDFFRHVAKDVGEFMKKYVTPTAKILGSANIPVISPISRDVAAISKPLSESLERAGHGAKARAVHKAITTKTKKIQHNPKR